MALHRAATTKRPASRQHYRLRAVRPVCEGPRKIMYLVANWQGMVETNRILKGIVEHLGKYI